MKKRSTKVKKLTVGRNKTIFLYTTPEVKRWLKVISSTTKNNFSMSYTLTEILTKIKDKPNLLKDLGI